MRVVAGLRGSGVGAGGHDGDQRLRGGPGGQKLGG